MAVVFHRDKFIIEIKTGASPIESWLNLQQELIDVLRSEDVQLAEKRPHCMELLQNMLPDLEQASKMVAREPAEAEVI